MKLALGIDPGSRRMGLALVPGPQGLAWSTTLVLDGTEPKDLFPELVREFGARFPIVVCEQIGLAVIEEFPKAHAPGDTSDAASMVREVMGAIETLCAIRGIPTLRVHPLTLKKAITGNGHASKEQMGKTVRARLGLPADPKTEHEADALGCAIIGEIELRRPKK